MPQTNGQWKQFAQSIENPVIIKEPIKIKSYDDVVVCLEEVKLKITGDVFKVSWILSF